MKDFIEDLIYDYKYKPSFKRFVNLVCFAFACISFSMYPSLPLGLIAGVMAFSNFAPENLKP